MTSERRIPVAGDPFHAEAERRDDEPFIPHGCYFGWVYLGWETEVDGELIEIYDRVPCRRCSS